MHHLKGEGERIGIYAESRPTLELHHGVKSAGPPAPPRRQGNAAHLLIKAIQCIAALHQRATPASTRAAKPWSRA